MNEKAIATYLKEVEKGIPKPEEHQINKQYNQLCVKCKGVMDKYKDHTQQHLFNTSELSLIIINIYKDIQEREIHYSSFLHCLQMNSQKLQFIHKNNAPVFNLLCVLIIKMLQDKENKDKQEVVRRNIKIILLLFSTDSNEKILKNKQFYHLFLCLTCLNVQLQIKNKPQIPFHLFQHLVKHISLLQKHMPAVTNELQAMLRYLVNVCISIFVFNGSSTVPKKFYQYIHDEEKMYIQKQQANFTVLNNVDLMMETLQKYAHVDPQYHTSILNDILKWSQFGILKQNMVSMFSGCIKLLNKQIIPNYHQSIFKMFLSLSSDQQKLKTFKILLYELLYNTYEQFIFKEKAMIINDLAIDEDIRRLLLICYYNRIRNNIQIMGKKLYNSMVQWNIQLNSIDPEEFMPIFCSKLQDLNQKTQIKIYTSQCTQLCMKMTDVLINQKLQYVYKQKGIIDFFSPQFLKHNSYTYLAFSKLFLKLFIDKASCQEVVKESHIQLSLYYTKNNRVFKEWVIAFIKKLQQHKIHSSQVFMNVIILASIVQGQQLLMTNYELSQYFINSLYNHDNYIHLMYELYRIFLLMKGKLILYLIVSLFIIRYKEIGKQNSIVSVQMDEEYFNNKCVMVFKNTSNMIANNKYLKYNTYCTQSLKLLLLLNLYSKGQYKQYIYPILISWSPFYNLYDLQMILYQFDKDNYKELLKQYKVFQNQDKITKSSVITHTLQLVRYIIVNSNKRIEAQEIYNTYNNCLQILPINNQLNKKNTLQVRFSFILNWSISQGFLIQICSCVNEKPYRLKITHHNGLFKLINKSQQILKSSKEIKINTLQPSTFTLRICNDRLTIFVQNQEVLVYKYAQRVDSIRVQTYTGIIMYNIICNCLLPSKQQRSLTYDQNYYVYKETQIKVKKQMPYLTLQKECLYFSKINQVYTLIKQIIKNCGRQLQISSMYKNMYEIVYAQLTHKYQELEDNCLVREIFNCLLKLSTETNKVQIPHHQQHKDGDHVHYYKLYLYSFINKRFFLQASKKCRHQLIAFTKELLGNEQVMLGIQNRQYKLFQSLLDICIWLSNPQQVHIHQKEQEHVLKEYYHQIMNIIHQILLKHQTSRLLLDKFTYFFYVALKNQKTAICDSFNAFTNKIMQILLKFEENQNFHQKIVSKYIILECNKLQYVFLLINFETKIKILDYFSSDVIIIDRIVNLFNNLPQPQQSQLIDWVIVINKRFISQIINLHKQTDHNLVMVQFFFETLIKCQPMIQQQNQRDQALISSMKFIMYIREKQKHKQEIKRRLANLACNQYLIIMMVRLILKFEYDEEKKRNTIQHFIYESLQMIFRMPKDILVRALKLLRNHSIKNIKITYYILKLSFIPTLPVYAINALFQHIIEVIMGIRNSICSSDVNQLAQHVKQFLDYIIEHYEQISKIKKPLLYVYPKLTKNGNFNDKKYLKHKLKTLKKMNMYELKGGLYFKLMCIVCHLIQMQPVQDCSRYLQFILDKVSVNPSKNNLAAYRAVSDFIQVSKDSKDRTHIMENIKQLSQTHNQYYEKQDLIQDQESKEQGSNLNVVDGNANINIVAHNYEGEEQDLTPFFIDYFLMKICLYLQFNCKIVIDEDKIKVNQKYSSLLIHYLKKYEHIFDEMSQKNVQTIVQVEDLEQLLKYEEKEQGMTVNDEVVSGHSHFRSRKVSVDMGKQFMPLFQTPKKKRRSQPQQIQNNSGIKRKQIFTKLEKDIGYWSEHCQNIKFHRFFRNQSKQIYIMELFHEYYVQSSSHIPQETIPISKSKKLSLFLQNFQKFISERQEAVVRKKAEKVKIRQVHNFTTKVLPTVQLKTKKIQNMSSPWFKKTKGSKYKLRQSSVFPQFNSQQFQDLHTQSLHFMEPLQQQEENLHYTVNVNNQQHIIQDMDNFCEITNRKGVFFCSWTFESQCVKFVTKKEKPSGNSEDLRIYKYGSPIVNIIKHQGKQFILCPDQVTEIFYRKFSQIQHNSIEFFFKDGRSLFLIHYTKKRTISFLNECMKRYPQLKNIKVVDNYVEDFSKRKYTDKWTNGQISNFDYLMLVNKYAGRSFNDLNQYFVFPWILSDYSSKTLDLRNPNIYRNLKKPIGALNENKLKRYEQKMRNQSEMGEEYLYGSHYSTSLFIYYYLVRLQPFSTLHKQFQGGEFDAPDRLFSSLQQMWECLISQSSTSDIKEAIPQFYYLPTFLYNINNFDLGVKQTGTIVSDVQLPKWASTPFDFILKMRAALQSDYVSSSINYWIDLIFGKDQYSKQKRNIFYPYAYQEKVNLQKVPIQSLDGIVSHITFFGQNPYPLFKKEHPKKKQRIGHSLLSEPQKLIMQKVDLEVRLFVKSITKVGPSEVIIQIGKLQSEALKSIYFSLQNPVSTIKRMLQTLEGEKRKSAQVIYEKETEIYIKNSQIIVEKDNSILHSLKLKGRFNKVIMNELVFVTYGGARLTVYDWSYQILMQFHAENEEVCYCHLENFFLLFGTSNGKLLGYDFFLRKKIKVHQFKKPTTKLQVITFCDRKLITKKNQIAFKILLLGDERKFVILYYRHYIGQK